MSEAETKLLITPTHQENWGHASPKWEPHRNRQMRDQHLGLKKRIPDEQGYDGSENIHP